MSQYLLFATLGLGIGGIYAALGMGLVMTYRGSGVINFAYGAMAMYASYVYSELTREGDLVLPVVGIPNRVDLGDPMWYGAALAISLTVGGALGLAIYVLVFRPLRHAPVLARVVASIGVMVALQAVVVLEFGTANRVVGPILPGGTVGLLGAAVPRDRLYLAGITVAVAILLAVVYRLTRFGAATRAAAENESAAALLGYSPSFLAGTNWVLSSVLAAAFGILIAPVSGLDPNNYTLFVVPALAAALVGRLSSFGATAAAGIALGVFQSVVTKVQTYQWMPEFLHSGLKEAVPFLLIVVVLFVAGRRLPARDVVVDRRLPLSPRPGKVALPAVLVGAGAVGLMLVTQGGYRLALMESVVAVVLLLSFVVLTGFVGQISLAQATFAGVSGFVLSELMRQSIPFPVAPILAAMTASAVGVLVGIPALRIRGVQLAVATLAGAAMIQELVFKNSVVTNGRGAVPVGDPSILGLHLGVRAPGGEPRVAFGVMLIVIAALLAVAVANLRRGIVGRQMLAVRANERAAAVTGVNVAVTKVTAFALSSFLAGLGGALIGYLRGTVSFDSFGAFAGLTLLAIAYLGGIVSVSGAVVGGSLVASGIAFTALDHWVGFDKYQLLVAGLALILTAVFNPDGIAGAGRKAAEHVSARYAGLWRRGTASVVGSEQVTSNRPGDGP